MSRRDKHERYEAPTNAFADNNSVLPSYLFLALENHHSVRYVVAPVGSQEEESCGAQL